MNEIFLVCPVCGGTIVGDGNTIALHCENVDLPLDREADAPVLFCNMKLIKMLCVIHRDGGHYIQKHGFQKAYDDAMEILHRWKFIEDDGK